VGKEFRRFLLRHRISVGGALVGGLLLILVLWTFVLQPRREAAPGPQDGPTGAEEPKAPAWTPPSPASLPPPQAVAESPAAGPAPRPAPSPAVEPPSPSSPQRAPEPPPPSSPAPLAPGAAAARALAGILGPLTGVAGPRGTTTILGPGRLVLEGERLRWSVLVVEGSPTHVALGIPLEPFGGEQTFWMAEEAGARGGSGARLVSGEVDLEPAFAEALGLAQGPLRVRIAGFHSGEDGGRIQVAGVFARIPLSKGL